jgi:hypothetical protein
MEATAATKHCKKCSSDQPIENFYEGYGFVCKGCVKAKSRRHYEARRGTEEHKNRRRAYFAKQKYADPLYVRKRHLWENYGITLEEYEALLAAQGNSCRICRSAFGERGARAHVDHCHETGGIRGVLCQCCNQALGLLRDSPAIAARASEYLAEHLAKRAKA